MIAMAILKVQVVKAKFKSSFLNLYEVVAFQFATMPPHNKEAQSHRIMLYILIEGKYGTMYNQEHVLSIRMNEWRFIVHKKHTKGRCG
jgi:hypothetical protein